MLKAGDAGARGECADNIPPAILSLIRGRCVSVFAVIVCLRTICGLFASARSVPLWPLCYIFAEPQAALGKGVEIGYTLRLS
jgi:hypothetical protein